MKKTTKKAMVLALSTSLIVPMVSPIVSPIQVLANTSATSSASANLTLNKVIFEGGKVSGTYTTDRHSSTSVTISGEGVSERVVGRTGNAGTYSFSYSTKDLKAGTYWITVRANANNKSQVQEVKIQLKIGADYKNSVQATFGNVKYANDTITGSYTTDRYSSTTIFINGNGVNEKVVGRTGNGATYNFSYSTKNLKPGTYEVVFRANARNNSEVQEYRTTLVIPEKTNSNSSSSSTGSNSSSSSAAKLPAKVSITQFSSANGAISGSYTTDRHSSTSVTISGNGVNKTVITRTGGAGTYSFSSSTKDLKPGTYTVTVRANANNGSAVQSDTKTFTVANSTASTAQPVAKVSLTKFNFANNAISGSYTTDRHSSTSVTISGNGVNKTVITRTGNAGTYSFSSSTKDLKPGTYTVTVRANANNGSAVQSDTETFTVANSTASTTIPVAKVSITKFSSANGTISGSYTTDRHSSTSVTISGNGVNKTVITRTGNAGTYSFSSSTKDLKPGTYTVTVRANANNGSAVQSVSKTFTVANTTTSTTKPANTVSSSGTQTQQKTPLKASLTKISKNDGKFGASYSVNQDAYVTITLKGGKVNKKIIDKRHEKGSYSFKGSLNALTPGKYEIIFKASINGGKETKTYTETFTVPKKTSESNKKSKETVKTSEQSAAETNKPFVSNGKLRYKNNKITLEFTTDQTGTATLVIINEKGNKVATKTQTVKKGNNTISYNAATLWKGKYKVELSVSNGKSKSNVIKGDISVKTEEVDLNKYGTGKTKVKSAGFVNAKTGQVEFYLEKDSYVTIYVKKGNGKAKYEQVKKKMTKGNKTVKFDLRGKGKYTVKVGVRLTENGKFVLQDSAIFNYN